MKNLLLLFAVVTAVLASGCSKEEAEPSIVGKWKYEESTSETAYTSIYEFKANGTGVMSYGETGGETKLNFTYSINGNKVTINLQDEEKQTATLTIISLTEKELTLKNEEGKTFTFHRI
ncbi:MAG: lipocalin family protein [Proteiniphilum sp.]|nr:lipocalin family protein [Proteiniphilum sp.]